jgi:hypothetical protein
MPADRFLCRLSDAPLNFALVTAAVWTWSAFIVLSYSAPIPALLLLLLGWPSRVLVGDDGISCGPFFRRRFFSYSDIAELKMLPGRRAVEVRLRDGEVLRLDGQWGWPEKIAALLRCATERRAAWGERRAADHETARAFVDGGAMAPYRGGTNPALLLAFARAPYVWPEMRMMAATRLAGSVNEPTKTFFGQLAGSTAEPRVRALFTKFANGGSR